MEYSFGMLPKFANVPQNLPVTFTLDGAVVPVERATVVPPNTRTQVPYLAWHVRVPENTVIGTWGASGGGASCTGVMVP